MAKKTFHKVKYQKAEQIKVEIGLYKTEIGAKTEAPKERGPYQILLINATDYCLFMGRIDGGNWFAIPTICRTCSSDYDTCFNERKWAGVMECQCTDRPFNLTLATRPDAQGHATGATWYITPDCNVAGGVIGLQ